MSFDDLIAPLDPPMMIVTAQANGEVSGCLVGFATQCSIDPPRWLVCISKRNHTHRVALAAEALACHIVTADRGELAELFGGETGDDVDKLARCEWSPGPGGAPILAALPAWMAGPVVARVDAGDHTAMVMGVTAFGPGHEYVPMTLKSVLHITPGHEA